MPKINLKLTVLDTLFILVSSFTILLLIMWMSGQVIGVDKFSNLPSWTTGMMDKAWGFLTTGAASAVIYWINRNKRSVPNYLFWILGTTVTLALLLFLAVKMIGNPNPPQEIKEAKIHFRLDYPNSPQSLAYIQQAPIWKNELRNIIMQPTGYFQEDIDVPEVGKKFVAKIKPRILDSHLSDSALTQPLEICFTRSEGDLPDDHIIAILRCNPNRIFETETADPGVVQLCGANQGPTVSWNFFTKCMAQNVPSQPVAAKGWSVPNLTTLITEKKTGFTQVNVNSTALSSSLNGSDAYSYAIKVNGTPIYIDGFQPKELRQSFQYSKGIQLSFGLQNLGFSGKNDGYEKIEILVEFYKKGAVSQQLICTFDYVALRSSDMQEMTASDGSKFTWSAVYTLPGKGVEFEVFNISSTDLQEIHRSKNKIDNAKLVYEGRPIVGVIRPPLSPNKNYGVILGLELPNKQIRFLYSQDEAKALIKWAKEQPGSNFSKSIYLYRITNKQRMPEDGSR